MDIEKYFGIALDDLRNFVSPTSFNYLTSILTGSHSEGDSSLDKISEGICTNWSESSGIISSLLSDNETIISSESKSGNSVRTLSDNGSLEDETEMMTRWKKGKNVLTVTVPFVLEEQERVAQDIIPKKRHLNLSSLQKPLGIKDDALCSHLYPVCSKIISKTTALAKRTTMGSIEPPTRSVSIITEKAKTFKRRDPSPYEELIGKISEVPEEFDLYTIKAKRTGEKKGTSTNGEEFRKKFNKTRTTAGVCDLSHPVSNPLYKIYDPKGYVKNEDELAREYIDKIGEEFNGWLATLEGDLVQLDSQLLTKILREELELPSPVRP